MPLGGIDVHVINILLGLTMWVKTAEVLHGLAHGMEAFVLRLGNTQDKAAEAACFPTPNEDSSL